MFGLKFGITPRRRAFCSAALVAKGQPNEDGRKKKLVTVDFQHSADTQQAVAAVSFSNNRHSTTASIVANIIVVVVVVVGVEVVVVAVVVVVGGGDCSGGGGIMTAKAAVQVMLHRGTIIDDGLRIVDIVIAIISTIVTITTITVVITASPSSLIMTRNSCSWLLIPTHRCSFVAD